MQSLLQRRTVGANAFARTAPSTRPVRVCKRIVNARSGKASRRATVECQAFFNFFTPKPAAPVSLVDPRAKPLVEQLIGLTSGTDAGAKASPAQKEEIAEVITELSRYCIKNPLKSDFLFGEWKVLFSSKPTAVGGPLRSGAGPAVFSGQSAKQIIEAPNKIVNNVTYKTLGFLPGFSRQYGTIEPVSADTFILNITDGEISAGLGGPIKKTFNIKRTIKILYLDDELRVAQFLPSADLPDTEADENGGRSGEDVVFVFQRITEEAEDEAQADDGEGAEQASKPAPFFGGGRKLESAATVAERQVRQQLKEQRGGSSKLAVAPAKAAGGSAKVAVAPPPRPGTQRGRKQPVEEVIEDPRERRRREQEEERARKAAEAEAKAAEAKAARERAEAERQAEREKQVAIKDLLVRLANEIKERQAEAREALKELKEVEKSTASGLKESQAARARLEEAEGDVKSISEQLTAAEGSRKEADKATRDAKELVVGAEKALRAAFAKAAPVIAGRK
ncbi:hypothetical protein PLESTB_000381600 [Pleodorina starrii]|uniref:Plastid lipid-associated protein/fibrillin conserved domain-containing protein n=1 Tax=Pleodorina starrii TaxID=330485 RepID=A0A9W6EZM9_9CHLO|nr:hypothetical protein PLESTM_000013500 [Pleodorina starrii]GLC50460.1 hypothetical protein PLESTB_000381600 [Pleodorina starrii]GLC73303.1 hypothetical protein PLESTF_001358400 [Pleodorina starrii]